jgi:hypothetical protein
MNELKTLLTNFILASGYEVLDDLTVKKKRKSPRKSNELYTANFERFLSEYPKRAGSTKKSHAWAKWKNMRDEKKVIEGTIRYRKFCEATGKIGTEWVMMPVTFLNNSCYMEEWTPPKVDKLSLMPKNSNLLCAWAEKNGYSQPRMGESMDQYRDRLCGEMR